MNWPEWTLVKDKNSHCQDCQSLSDWESKLWTRSKFNYKYSNWVLHRKNHLFLWNSESRATIPAFGPAGNAHSFGHGSWISVWSKSFRSGLLHTRTYTEFSTSVRRTLPEGWGRLIRNPCNCEDIQVRCSFNFLSFWPLEWLCLSSK